MKEVYKYSLFIAPSELPEDTFVEGCGTIYKQDPEEISPFGSLYIHRDPIGAFVLKEKSDRRFKTEETSYEVTIYTSCDMGEHILCGYDLNIIAPDRWPWWRGGYGSMKFISDILALPEIPKGKRGFLGSASKEIRKEINNNEENN